MRVGARFGSGDDKKSKTRNVTFWCPVNIDGCQISGAVDFTSARFAEGFSARETRFSTVFFEGAAFEGAQARFVNAIFEGNAFFGTTLFQREADFTGARFLKPVSFSRASVTSDCGPTIVSKDLVEKMKGGAIFRGAASFDNVMFADKADFTETSFKDVSFEDATAKEISFDSAVGFPLKNVDAIGENEA